MRIISSEKHLWSLEIQNFFNKLKELNQNEYGFKKSEDMAIIIADKVATEGNLYYSANAGVFSYNGDTIDLRCYFKDELRKIEELANLVEKEFDIEVTIIKDWIEQ